MSNAYRSVLKSGGAVPTGDAVAADVLTGKTFSNANAVGIAGAMVNNGAVSQTLSPGQSYTIPAGYHNGSGVVTANQPTINGAETGQDYSNMVIGDYYVLTWMSATQQTPITSLTGANVILDIAITGANYFVHSTLVKASDTEITGFPSAITNYNAIHLTLN